MDIAEAQKFLRENACAVLTTWRRDGRIQMSPITVGLNDDGKGIISSRETAYKVKNIQRDPRVSLCAFVDEFTGPWIQIDGKAEVVLLPEAMELLVDYYRRVAGEHQNWDEYRQAMTKERRVMIRITIENAGPDRKG